MLKDYENFTPEQIEILKKYVTNTSSHIFVLRNLPEVIKGALFSRYSRSSLGLRSLLLKEFISNDEEAAFHSIVQDKTEPEDLKTEEQMLAIKKAQNFYDRILDGYGDDSIGELGGAHLALENISMLAAKIVEDCRIGGSPLEKSTRYIYFDQKVNGEFLYYREPILMTSAFRDIYLQTCDMLFETYGKLIPPLTEIMESRFPKSAGTSSVAYASSIRAKVLDCLRGLLPAGTLTNMGLFGNGRFYEHLLHKLHCHNLAEAQEIGKCAYEELSKTIPSFVRRAELSHHTHQAYAQFYEAMESEIGLITEQYTQFPERTTQPGVRLLNYDPEQKIDVAAALLFAHSNKGLAELKTHCQQLPEEAIERILDAASSSRDNRRQKSPRALEHASFTFEIIADFGSYRDLQRHRILTQERELLGVDYGYYIPEDIRNTELLEPYCEAIDKAKEVYKTIASELPEEAQYVVPMAFNIRWYFNINLRALQWLCELRSSPAGHPTYREIAIRMAEAVSEAVPSYKRFFKFVDDSAHDLGRLNQEENRVAKQMQLTSE
ncbi:MAG: FAD-dependent thymidylate synthase [Chlamydiales bacterium]